MLREALRLRGNFRCGAVRAGKQSLLCDNFGWEVTPADGQFLLWNASAGMCNFRCGLFLLWDHFCWAHNLHWGTNSATEGNTISAGGHMFTGGSISLGEKFVLGANFC